MIHIFAQPILKASFELNAVEKKVTEWKKQNPSQLLLDGHCSGIARLLDTAKDISEKLNLVETKKRIEMFLSQLLPDYRDMSAVHADLIGLHRSFNEEMCHVNFAFIASDKLQYFEQEKLFGEKVFDKFPNAREDIKSVGNCLAADLGTAAVFHLMSVVNIGLLELAKHLNLKIKAIEFQEWKNIIDGLKKKVDSLNQKPKGRKKQAALEFYNGLLLELAGFKDVYRNNVSHARMHYKYKEAESVYDRVHDFMQRLAGGISTTHERENKKLAKKISKVLFEKPKGISVPTTPDPFLLDYLKDYGK
jgi:hypothetical protein